MRRGMLLGEVVGEVVAAFAPMDDVLVLADAVLDPIKTHVHGFGAALLDCVIDDAHAHTLSVCIGVGLEGVQKFEQCDTERRCIFCVMKKRAGFGFSGRGQNRSHDG